MRRTVTHVTTSRLLLTLAAAVLCASGALAQMSERPVGGSGGGGGSSAFGDLTSGTNTSATMTVGTGAAIAASGSGAIAATTAAALAANPSDCAGDTFAQAIAASGNLTCAGVPLAAISGLGTGVATALGTPSSANLAAALTDETGSGALVFANTPTLVTPDVGAATGTSLVLSGNVTAANLITGGTLTDTQFCVYNSTGPVFDCNVGFSGTGNVARVAGATLTTPALGVATATSLNGLTVTTSTGTLTVANSKVLTASNTLTLTGTDASSVAFGSGGVVSYTIASGATTLNTSAVNTGTCGSAQTASATGTATTDAITWTFNADPTAVTGYSGSVNGMLTIIVYPTTNTVNFKVCNNTASNITPGAVTLNWRVVR